jgi:hypothetical protein
MRLPLTLLLIACVGALSACKTFSGCVGPSDIGEGGESIPPLRVPTELEMPNTAEALRIPKLNEPERPRPPDVCLDQPPSYFPDRRPGAEAEKPAGQ